VCRLLVVPQRSRVVEQIAALLGSCLERECRERVLQMGAVTLYELPRGGTTEDDYEAEDQQRKEITHQPGIPAFQSAVEEGSRRWIREG